jgi:Tfp pilus assembly protein PilV
MRLINHKSANSMNRISNIKHQIGVTLIEALVAMVVFSIGALGLAAMQLASMTQTEQVKKTTLVSFKLQGLIERMQTSVTSTDTNGLYAEYATAIQGLPGNNGATTFAGSGIGTDDGAGALTCVGAAPAACSAVGSCTPAQLVTRDVWEVFCDADTGLAAAAVERDSNIDTAGDGSSGVIGLGPSQVQVLMVVNATTGNELYVETVANDADTNSDLVENTITTNLCGTSRANLDASLDIYCIKF